MLCKDIPLFDSLSHATVDGSWVFVKKDQANDIATYAANMETFGINWSFAVQMPGDADAEYAAAFYDYPHCYPIFYLAPGVYHNEEALETEIASLRTRGYVGIKIHPRLSQAAITDPIVIKAIQLAGYYKLIAMLCTFFYDDKPYSLENNETTLRSLLMQTKGTEIILIHGGLVKVLEYMEIVKPFQNVLLDLSYTWMKYEGTSLEQDLIYLFRHFDRRICIGSDAPDYSVAAFKKRFETFCTYNIPIEKMEQIAYKNLLQLITKLGYYEAQ